MDQRLSPRERAALEGERIFRETIDQASGTTAEERRQAIDEVIDRGKCQTCGRRLP